jgi:hypothetical protein
MNKEGGRNCAINNVDYYCVLRNLQDCIINKEETDSKPQNQ